MVSCVEQVLASRPAMAIALRCGSTSGRGGAAMVAVLSSRSTQLLYLPVGYSPNIIES